jgi:hypothetical protein
LYPRLYRAVPIFGVAVLGLAVIFIGVVLASPRVGGGAALGVAFLIAVGAFAVVEGRWMVFGRWGTAWRGRALIGRSEEYELTDDGIAYAGPLGSGLLRWSAMTSIRSNEGVVVGVNDRLLVWYAPRAALGTPEMQAEIIAFMQRRTVEANLAAGRRPPGAKYKVVG